jgi:outer membrane protein assembly factor BamB
LTGLIRADGSLAWHTAPDRSPTNVPAFGDFTGRGRVEAVGVGYDDGIRCYDAASGELRWVLPSPPGVSSAECASADTDSDGRDEVLLTSGAALYCIGCTGPPDTARGELRWKLDLPAVAGPPAIVDVDGSRRAQILVACADGFVYGVVEPTADDRRVAAGPPGAPY